MRYCCVPPYTFPYYHVYPHPFLAVLRLSSAFAVRVPATPIVTNSGKWVPAINVASSIMCSRNVIRVSLILRPGGVMIIRTLFPLRHPLRLPSLLIPSLCQGAVRLSGSLFPLAITKLRNLPQLLKHPNVGGLLEKRIEPLILRLHNA